MADAPASGAGARKGVKVQVLSFARVSKGGVTRPADLFAALGRRYGGGMNRSTASWSIVGALVILGVGGVSLAHAEKRAEPIVPPGTATWSYLCFSGNSASEVMEKANRAGAQGWEMVSAAPGNHGAIWCFRQPRWARPQPVD